MLHVNQIYYTSYTQIKVLAEIERKFVTVRTRSFAIVRIGERMCRKRGNCKGHKS